jgi:hypothetical protein
VKCLETRRTPEGFKRRRYERTDGVRITTVEVPIELWSTFNRQGRGNRLAGWTRARERDALRLRALEQQRLGWKAIASAHELGVPVRTVQRWRSEAAA